MRIAVILLAMLALLPEAWPQQNSPTDGFTADNVNGYGWRLMGTKQKISYVRGMVDGMNGLIFAAQANGAPYEPLRKGFCQLTAADSVAEIMPMLDSYYRETSHRKSAVPMAVYIGFGISKCAPVERR